nr:hypothetical protein [Tanacetum cinerariifolium]
MGSIISMVSISLECFLPSILLLVVVIVAVILVVVVVVIDGVVIVVMIIGVESLRFRGGKISFNTFSSRTILIGQEPFQFSLGDLVSLLYSNRFGIGIPLGQGILGESNRSKFHFTVLGTVTMRKYRFSSFKPTNEINSSFRTIEVERLATYKLLSSGGVIDLTGDENPTDEDRDTGVGDSKVFVSLGEISSGGSKSQESSIGDTEDGGKAVGRAIIVSSRGIDSVRSCVIQCTLPTQGMGSIISMVSISLEGFLPSIWLLRVVIVTLVIVAVILVVVVVAVDGVVIVVMII